MTQEYIITERDKVQLLYYASMFPNIENILNRARPYTNEREKLLDKFEHWLDIRERRALKAGADNHAEAFYDAREYLWELRKGEQK